MKTACSFVFLACVCSAAVVASADTKVSFYADDIVRVTKTQKGALPDKIVPIVVLKQGDVRLEECCRDGLRQWKSAALIVTLDEKNGRVSFYDTDSRLLLAENADAQYKVVRGGDLRARQSFALQPDEAIYGLGLLQNGKLSQRGENRWLLPENTEDGIPFIQSVRGWSIYWDEISPVRFVDDASGMSFESDVCDGIDYYFMYGRSIDGNVAAMRRLTGDVPMMPLWTYGYWQSRERYKTQDELARDLPGGRG